MTVALKPHLTPHSEAVEWLLTQPDAETAWNTCDCADWMLWLAEKAGVETPVFVRIACEIARTVLHLAPKGEARPRLAIEAAEAWLANPTEENIIAVDEAAACAAWAAHWAARAAAWAADSAAWAAWAACEASCAAAFWAAWPAAEAACAVAEAACAAYAARKADAKTANAAHAAADAAARVNCADIVRKHIPFTAIAYLVETETVSRT